MANLNRVMLIGRLTRDVEVRTFANGGKVASFGFAVNNRKKGPSGQWEDVPVFVDCEAFNRGEFGKTADLCEQYLKKGSQAYLEGHLQLDEWQGRDGQKRSKPGRTAMAVPPRRGSSPQGNQQRAPRTKNWSRRRRPPRRTSRSDRVKRTHDRGNRTMLCETCNGQRFIGAEPDRQPCPTCGGCGIDHCCSGDVAQPNQDTEEDAANG
jgi:single-strand DNA-binding protein